MVTYQDKDIDLTTDYLIEYIDNQADLDYVNSGRTDKGEPWERYKTKRFGDVDSALSAYMVMWVRDDIFDIRLFEEIKISGETIREQFIEPALTTGYSIRLAVNKEMENAIVRLEEKVKNALNTLSDYEGFVKKFGVEKAFKEYQKETSVA